MSDHVLWTELYRPKKVADAVLPESVRSVCQGFVDQALIPNVLLVGPPGVGKTTVAKAMCDELGSDWYLVNSSLNRNIETLRVDVADFASGVSLAGGRKYVILDEADHLNPVSFQPALRAFMEEYASNCGFIMTCNYPEKIIEPLRDSRVSQIDFRPKITDDEKAVLLVSFFKSIAGILVKEGVSYQRKALAELVNQCFPDWRQCINRLQTYASKKGRTIDEGILVRAGQVDLAALVSCMKAKNFTGVRKWVGEIDLDPVSFYRQLYDECKLWLEPGSVPQLVTVVAEYSFRSAFVADQEVSMAACLAHLMSQCEFRK